MTRNRLTASLAGLGLAECVSIAEIRNPVPEALGRDQIEKIAASVTFSRAEQLRDLLRWLGGRSLAEPQVSPSEKDIADQVLKRQDFDPRTDALVRKEMGRLREKLSRYYLSEGIRDSVVVTANSGYLLKFEHGPGRNSVAGTGACWLVLPFRVRGGTPDAGVELLEEVVFGLQERGGPELVSPATALAFCERGGDLRHFAAECRADFVVEGSLRRRDDSVEATVWFVDAQTGRTLRARRIHGPDLTQLALEAVSWLLEKEGEPAAAVT